MPKYITEMEWEQDLNESVLKNEKYDLKNFSKHESDTIKHVLDVVKNKYPNEYYSLGLANESYTIKYKPRYVLYEIIILKYSKSNSFIDKFAVSLAYESKGAFYRKNAIAYFEESEHYITPSLMDDFVSYMPLHVYTMFSKLYEQEHDYEKAISLTKMAKKYGDPKNPYFDIHINELIEKKLKIPKKRKTSISQDQINFENEVTNAAQYFLQYF